MSLYRQFGGTLSDVTPHHEAIQRALCAIWICCLHQVSWVLVALPWSSSMPLVSLMEQGSPAHARGNSRRLASY